MPPKPGYVHSAAYNLPLDSIERARVLFEKHFIPEPNSGCWIWTGAVARFGHGSLKFQRKTNSAHRVSWRLHFGTLPAGAQVLHRCDVPCCVNPDHLFLGTQLDNVRDCIHKGRRRDEKGEEKYFSKLKSEQVSSILLDTRSYSAIAESYGISKGVIGNIKAGRAWKHIPRAGGQPDAR